MIREARLLKAKSLESLLLSIDHFNGLSDIGRANAVLILLDHSFELLLKAAILSKGGRIRAAKDEITIGFDACVRKALSDVHFIDAEQALTLQALNGLRDAAQHYLLDISEGQLYLHAQAGVTLYRDLLLDVFKEDLRAVLPERALPISTIAPVDPIVLFNSELEQVRRLLAPGKRRHAEARARLRALAIVDRALQGEMTQPSEQQLDDLGRLALDEKALEKIFPGIAAVTFATDGHGADIALRITKNEGVPVRLVPEGTPGSAVVAVRRVDELGFYNLGHRDLAAKVGLTTNKTTAAIALLDLKTDPETYKAFRIGRSVHQRYSPVAIERIQKLVEQEGAEGIWIRYRASTA